MFVDFPYQHNWQKIMIIRQSELLVLMFSFFSSSLTTFYDHLGKSDWEERMVVGRLKTRSLIFGVCKMSIRLLFSWGDQESRGVWLEPQVMLSHHGSDILVFSFEKLLNMLDHILGWVGCWLKTIITNAVSMDILKNMRRFEFSAARAHYPPCIGKFSLG
jgi:hypothetical protein